MLDNLYEYDYKWILYIVEGIPITLKYSMFSVFFGLIIGALSALMIISNNNMLKIVGKSYISVIRGTPVLLQLSFVYWGLPVFINIKVSPFAAGILAFSINSSAYIAEIIRAGIQSLDKGQFEAAKVLSIPYYLVMRDIILPQAIRNILPALINEVITMIKESSLIGTIGEADLMRRANLIGAQQYVYYPPLIVAGICYYLLIIVLNYFAKILEKKLHARY